MVETYAADLLVFEVILRLLDHVPADDGLFAVIIVLLVCDKVRLAEQFLLVILELSHHAAGLESISGFCMGFPFFQQTFRLLRSCFAGLMAGDRQL